MGCPQLTPLTVKFDIGQRNGVGKKAVEWVGMSTKICNPHAKMGRKGLRLKNQTNPNTKAKITKLCVML